MIETIPTAPFAMSWVNTVPLLQSHSNVTRDDVNAVVDPVLTVSEASLTSTPPLNVTAVPGLAVMIPVTSRPDLAVTTPIESIFVTSS